MHEDTLQTIDYFLHKIKLTCAEPLSYQSILCNLILQNKPVDNKSTTPTISEAETRINQLIAQNNDLFPSMKDRFYKELYQSWLTANNSIISPSSYHSSSVASILAWGYGTKFMRKNKAAVDCELNKMNKEGLAALWEAIAYSEATSLAGLHNFTQQTSDDWRISCEGIAKSSLNSFIFGRHSYLKGRVSVYSGRKI